VRKWIILGVVLAVALAAGLWTALRREDPGVLPSLASHVPGTRTVELFFPGSAGGLQRETREIVGSDFLENDVRRAVEELIAGPESGVRPLPATTRVLSVFYDRDGEVTVNFSDDLTVDHPGGSDAEIETIRCLVATLGANFPGVDRVRILVEGDVVSTLAGHMDLSRPLRVDDFD
jgi:hypothetical protein